MSSHRRAPHVAAAALILHAVCGAQTPVPEPTFGAGDLALLECRVVDARVPGNSCCLLTVEVANTDKAAVEPLEFRIALQEKAGVPPRVESFHRTSLPRFRRFGRPTPPGGRQKYVLLTTLIGKRPQYTVRVAQASWNDGAAVPRPELLVGDPVQVQLESLAGTFPVTQVELKNPFDRALDALFLVTFTQPRDTVELCGVHLPANKSLSWALTSLPGARTWAEPNRLPGCAMKSTKFELVDWSFVAAGDPAAGAELLRGAYAAWLRWPEPHPAVSGHFRSHERRKKVSSETEYDDFVAAGRFTLDAAGKVAIVIESGRAANADRVVKAAFANLRRESWDTVLKENVLQPIDADRVEVRGPAFGSLRRSGAQLSAGDSADSAGFHDYVQVQNGRIVSSGTGDQFRTAWETRELGNGYVVVRTRSESTEATFSYQQAGNLLMPERTTTTVIYGDKLFSTDELSLSDLKTEGVEAMVRPVPQGAGAAALSAIWNAGYRFPTGPIRTSAGFEVTHPGTDLIWCGVKKLKGTFAMEGIGRNLRSLRLDFEGKLSPDLEMTLVGVFRDRLLMWYGGDLGDRPDFAEFFAGATIDAPAADGSFRIQGGSIAKVLTEGGLVRGWVYPDGSKRTYTWQDFAGRMAVTKIETILGVASGKSRDVWTETVTITLAKVGEHLLPTKLQLEKVFGKDWGPETLTFKGLKLE